MNLFFVLIFNIYCVIFVVLFYYAVTFVLFSIIVIIFNSIYICIFWHCIRMNQQETGSYSHKPLNKFLHVGTFSLWLCFLGFISSLLVANSSIKITCLLELNSTSCIMIKPAKVHNPSETNMHGFHMWFLPVFH